MPYAQFKYESRGQRLDLPKSNKELFKIHIPNFYKHQTRKDVKSMNWIKISTSMMHDERLILCTPTTRWLYICLLLKCGKDKCDTSTLSVHYASKTCAIRVDLVRKGVNDLQRLQLLKVLSRNGYVPREEKKREEYMFNLDLIYDAYPRKAGKKGGLKKLKSMIKTQELFDEVLAGARSFKDHCDRNNTAQHFIPLFSSWVNQERWRDELANDNDSHLQVGEGGFVEENYFE